MSRKPQTYHEDVELFRAALSFTQSETGFSARLVEKDYFCTLLLEDLLGAGDPPWVFKGGTCLSKVHTDFYRMSEDLDFAFSAPFDTSRSERSKIIEPMKQHLASLERRLPCFGVVEGLRGFNNSTQYVGGLQYRSLATEQDESIKVEFSIREPILERVERLPAKSLLIDPFRHTAAVAPLEVAILSCRETYAEKLRAALTRREPAIRDFYDIDHGIRSGRLNPADRRLLKLVKQKLAVPGNDAADLSDQKRAALKRQVQAQLRPVLRETDFTVFDLDRAFSVVAKIANDLR
jgi:predicted nucleotidyltransferase component of viral defense system